MFHKEADVVTEEASSRGATTTTQSQYQHKTASCERAVWKIQSNLLSPSGDE